MFLLLTESRYPLQGAHGASVIFVSPSTEIRQSISVHLRKDGLTCERALLNWGGHRNVAELLQASFLRLHGVWPGLNGGQNEG